MTVVYRQITVTPQIAKKAEEAGADIIVATGMDEGGDLPGNNIGTFSIVPLFVDSVKIPVMAAGGITDRRTFNAAFALGAEGVLCETLFLSSKEARIPQNVKDMILKANATDLDFFRTHPYYYRSIPTPLSSFLITLAVNTAVFPDPAPADTIKLLPSKLMASSCSLVHLGIYLTS